MADTQQPTAKAAALGIEKFMAGWKSPGCSSLRVTQARQMTKSLPVCSNTLS